MASGWLWSQQNPLPQGHLPAGICWEERGRLPGRTWAPSSFLSRIAPLCRWAISSHVLLIKFISSLSPFPPFCLNLLLPFSLFSWFVTQREQSSSSIDLIYCFSFFSLPNISTGSNKSPLSTALAAAQKLRYVTFLVLFFKYSVESSTSSLTKGLFKKGSALPKGIRNS